MDSLPTQLWNAWKTFPEWWNQFWGIDWGEWTHMGWLEWTNGVITPFVITGLAPVLGAKPVRLEIAGEKKKRTRADYTMMKNNTVLAYLEHETKLTEAYGELEKLLAATAPLKGVVTYGSEKEVQELAKDVRRRLEEHNDMAEWIVIAGLGEMETPDAWIAYSFSRDIQPTKLE